MRIAFSRKTKTVVSIAAVLLSLLLIAVWGFLAFLTVNTIGSYDYNKYYGTKAITFSFDDLKNDLVYGIAFYAGYGDEQDKADAIRGVYKEIFVFVDKESAQTESFLSYFENASVTTNFCSEDRETLEQLYKKNRFFTYILFSPTAERARLASKMGYNCAVPYNEITASQIGEEHENNRYFCAYGVHSAEQFYACKNMKVDFVFISASY